ncbi:MAG: 3-phosphoshikimate 1-carboxyvinyltransferase [Eubacteriales bacterium]
MPTQLHNYRLEPGRINGRVRAPSSKSMSHRALICASLAGGESEVRGIDFSDDITATTECMRTLGARIVHADGVFHISGGKAPAQCVLDCGESGSTLRFLVPVAAALGTDARFTGRGTLLPRPMGLFRELLRDSGANVSLTGEGLPMTISGQLRSGRYTLPGNVSSQFVSGLLFSLPLLDGDSEIVLTSRLESVAYVEMTIKSLRDFGVEVSTTQSGYYIKGGQSYSHRVLDVEGDYSQAAFFACAAAISGRADISGLDQSSLQGDKGFIELLNEFGASCRFEDGVLKCRKGELRAIEIDGTQIPDILPVLSVVAAYAKGTTRIYNAARLRIKESDRIKSVCDMLCAIGAKAEEREDGMVITGSPVLRGGSVSSMGDHRIAMSAAVASLGCADGVVVDDMSCMSKSYPAFLDDFLSIYEGKRD